MTALTITVKQLRQLCEEDEDGCLIIRPDLEVYDWPHEDGKPATYPRKIIELQGENYVNWFQAGGRNGWECSCKNEDETITVIINQIREINNLKDIL
jgi:hypothetical protein